MHCVILIAKPGQNGTRARFSRQVFRKFRFCVRRYSNNTSFGDELEFFTVNEGFVEKDFSWNHCKFRAASLSQDQNVAGSLKFTRICNAYRDNLTEINSFATNEGRARVDRQLWTEIAKIKPHGNYFAAVKRRRETSRLEKRNVFVIP